MFSRGDFDLNLVLRYDPLPKEVLKQAMLKQEHIFRKQVCELRRLHRMQQILTNGALPVLLPAEKSSCAFPMASTRLTANSLQEHRVVLVHQLCPNEHINHNSRDNLIEENILFYPQNPIEINHSFHDQVTASSLEEVDLSLSIGWNQQRKVVSFKKTWDHIISLEDSDETEYSGGNNDLSSTHSITLDPNKNQSDGAERSYSTIDCSMSLLEQSSFTKGVTRSCSVLISDEDMPTNGKRFSSDERALLDLNLHPDELSFHPCDPGSSSSSTRSCKMELEGSNLKLDFQNGSHDSDSPLQGSSGSGTGSKNTEDTRFSDEYMTHQDALVEIEVDKSPILIKESGTYLSNSSTHSDNAGSSQAAKSPCQENAESSGNNDSNYQIGDDQKGKAPEVDNEVQKGVASLFFTLECTRDQSQKENDSNEKPQYSSDTFESMVLKLPECNVEDDSCTSSKPHFEVNNSNNRTGCGGIAVRRGSRRMKDFRRDILPNLASLSRDEISEDVKIMEAVLKSSEYKKIMSKMKGGQKCFIPPARGRRSRINRVGQKHHS